MNVDTRITRLVVGATFDVFEVFRKLQGNKIDKMKIVYSLLMNLIPRKVYNEIASLLSDSKDKETKSLKIIFILSVLSTSQI